MHTLSGDETTSTSIYFYFVVEYFNPNSVNAVFTVPHTTVPNKFFDIDAMFLNPTRFTSNSGSVTVTTSSLLTVTPGVSRANSRVELTVESRLFNETIDYLPDGSYEIFHRYFSGTRLNLQFSSGEAQFKISEPSWESEDYAPITSTNERLSCDFSFSSNFDFLWRNFGILVIVSLIVGLGLSFFFLRKFRKKS